MDMGLRALLLSRLRLVLVRLAAGRKRDLVQKLRVLAAHQHVGIVGDGVEQRHQPGLVDLGEIAEHMGVDEVLDARMADAEPQTAILLAAMGVDRFDAVVAAVAAADLDAGFCRRQIQLVIDDGDILRMQLVEAHGFADRLAGEVHEGLRLHQQNPFAADFTLGDLGLEFLRPGGKVMAAMDDVDSHETDIVAV